MKRWNRTQIAGVHTLRVGRSFGTFSIHGLPNLRLDFGQHLSSLPLRMTTFASAQPPTSLVANEPALQQPTDNDSPPLQPSGPLLAANEPALQHTSDNSRPPVVYGPPRWAHPSFTKGFAGSDFVPQPDGTLRCPAGHPLKVHERRPERNGSVRVVYGARRKHCSPCPLRAPCQQSVTTRKPRQVSAVLWPLKVASPILAQPSPPVGEAPFEGKSPPPLAALALAPVLWGDWPRCQLRRHFMRLLRTQTVELSVRAPQAEEGLCASQEDVQTRAQRAHWRLSWQQRFARHARLSSAPFLTMTIYGLPAAFAQYIGVSLLTVA